jgi:hypothetical protein
MTSQATATAYDVVLIRALLERAGLREMCLEALSPDRGRAPGDAVTAVSAVASASGLAAAAPKAAA